MFRKSFGKGSQRIDVLNGINLEVAAGEFVAIVEIWFGQVNTTLLPMWLARC